MSESTDARQQTVVPMSIKELIRIGAIGAVVGALSVGLYALFYNLVFQAVMCRPQSMTTCAQAPGYAAILTLVLASLVALTVLARLRTYRPLLAVLATAFALWGIQLTMVNLPWYGALISMTLLGAISFALFAWIARIRSFILALVVTVVLVTIVRLVVAS